MISIIIPVYNVEDYLERCIDSVLASSYKEFEIILVDDGSVDRSGAICEAYRRRDSRVRYFRQRHGGVSSARNKGLDECRGTWIVFVDPDDFITPDYLEIIADRTYEREELLLFDFIRLHGGGRLPDGRGVFGEGDCIVYGEQDRLHLIRCLLNMDKLERGGSANLAFSWTKAYKKSVIDRHKIRFAEDLSLSEDKLFNIEYLLKAKRFTYIRRPVYFWVVREGSATQGYIRDFLKNDIVYQYKLRSFLEHHQILSEVRHAYYNSVLSNMANILIRGIFHPGSTRTWQGNCGQCDKMYGVDIYRQAERYNRQAGILPRRLLLFFYYRRNYRMVSLISRMSFRVLEKAGRLS